MNAASPQRVKVISRLAIGLLAATAIPASVGLAQSTIQITGWDGNVLPAAAGLYTAQASCSNPQGMPGATVCSWVVRRLYGNLSPVVVVLHVPGTNPACNSGYTQQISPGYSRTQCALYATPDVYGQQ